jgi:hypothetical protein
MTDDSRTRVDPVRSPEPRARPKTSAASRPILPDPRRQRDPIDDDVSDEDAGEGFKGPLVDATLVDETKVPPDTASGPDRPSLPRGGRPAV